MALDTISVQMPSDIFRPTIRARESRHVRPMHYVKDLLYFVRRQSTSVDSEAMIRFTAIENN
jgi:hypothetical protein